MKSKNLLKFKNNLTRTVLLPIMVVLLVMGFNPDTFAQETVTTDPAMDVTNTINICVGGTVTVSIGNSTNGITYALQKTSPNPPEPIQTLSGTGGTIQFLPINIFSSAESYTIGVLNGSTFIYVKTFTVAVVPDPVAPTLTLSQAEGSVNAGPTLSASLDVAGSGGVGTMVNAYEYSTDNGLTWNNYTLESSISTTQFKIPSVKIKASRYSSDGLGCSSERIYTWTIISRVHDVTGTQGSYFGIQQAIDATNTASGDVLELDPVTFDEQVLVNKEVTIKGTGGQPTVDFTGTITGKPTLLDISANNVTIENIHFNVDLARLRSAVIVSAVGIDNITIKNNLVDPYGTPAGVYGERNAFSINYAGYRVASGGVDNVTFQGNTVNGSLPGSFFRAAIALDEGGGTFSGNTLQTINHDILVRFASNGNVTVSNNISNGGGMELSDQNAGAGIISVTGNTFNGTGAPATAMLRIKNNYNSISHVVSTNTFNNYEWAVSLENMNNTELNGNLFNTSSATAHAVVINTKSISSNSNTIVQVSLSSTLKNNNFNGTGNAVTFQNHDSDNDSYGTFVMGTAGNENSFASTLSSFIVFDNQIGSTNGSTFPAYPTTGGWPTTMACWDQNLNAEFNKFDVGSGLQLPSVMNFAERTTLENKLFHKLDASCVGVITTFYPVKNITQNAYYHSIQAAVTAANANDEIECAEYTYNEKVVIDKKLWLHGVNEANCIIDGTGLGVGSGIYINNGVTGVKIELFTIKNHAGTAPNNYAGIYAPGGNNNLTIQHCTIKDNVGGCGVYANGPITDVLFDDLDISGHTNAFGAARGIVIWNGLKSNITVTNCEVYNNNCCGIELQDGTATGVTMANNNVHDNGDNGFGLTGMQGPGENLIKDNTVTNNGRFGIEIKNPNGSGLATGAGRVVVETNTVSRTNPIGAEARDIVGIAAFRRGVLAGNVDVPTGVIIQNNTVLGYTQPSTSDGFGIVVEGTNHSVLNNGVTGCDVGIQQQVNPTGYPGDDPAMNLDDQYFGRGNSPVTCGITMSGNTYSSNGIDTRNVGSVGGAGFVVNTNTGKTFCSIQSAIDDAATVTGNIIKVSAGTFNENVVLNKSVTLQGAGPASTILTPLTACGGTGVIISAAGAKLKDLKVTNYSNGLAVSSTGNEIINVESVSNCNAGLELSAGTGDLSVINSKLNNNTVMGFRKGTTPAISGFLMDGCEVIGNLAQGCFIATAAGAGLGTFDNVTIQNSIISNNKQKGLYFEALSNALLKNLTMDNNGTDAAYGFNNGIDINLKYRAYSNITIQDCEITNSGYTGTATDPQNAAVLAIKGRDDATSYNMNPATLDNVIIKNNKITGPQNGIRFGEFGKTNATPTNVKIEGNDLSYAFANKALVSRINADINLVCNWHGSTDLATVLATFTEGGSGSFVMSTILDAGTDGNGAVGFQPSGNCTCPSGNVVTNTNTSETFCSIQAAIDDPQTLNGHTLSVGPGTYIENIIVNKSLTINGPNEGISPNGGSRVSEAILVTAVKDLAHSEIIHVAASNVTIKGFTFDGDNTALISGFTSTNGADIDAAEGITVYETGINNLIVQNNIFKNLAYFGVTLYDYPAGLPSSGHVISDNKFQDFGTYDSGSGVDFWGGGVLIYNNQYTRIANNVMTNVRLGIQTGNFYQANPGLAASQVFDNNNIQARRTGIFHNLHYSSASAFTLSNNTITALDNINETRWDGIALSSLSVPSISDNNIINGNNSNRANLTKGYELWNVQSPVTENTINGGSITGVDIGVFANNYEGYSSDGGDGAHGTISNLTISPKTGGTGIRILDSPSSTSHSNVQLAIGSGVVVNGGANGLVIENASAQAITPVGNLALNSQTSKYIQLIGNSNNIDATSVSFNGKTGATATLAENFAIEDKVFHAMDDLGVGLVTWVPSNVYVTTSTLGIQRGIDVVPNSTVNVAAGTYAENVVVNKSVTLLGANANVACGSKGVESIISPTSGLPVSVTANGVTINGFEITAPAYQYAISCGNTSDLTISYNNIHDIGTSITNTNVHSIIYMVANAASTSNVNILDNCIEDISSSLLTGYSAAAIGILQSTSTGTLTGLNIERNTINNVNVNTGQWPTGKGAYGIQLNTGSANYFTTAGKIANAVIRNNEISNLSGHFTTGIGLEGNTENAVVENNSVAYLSGTKTDVSTGGAGYDLNGLKFETNRYVSTCTVQNNSFQTNTFNHSAGSGLGYAVANYVPSANGGTATLNCNWFGTADYNDILQNGLAGKILNKTGCITNFTPYLTSGIDNEVGTLGFQPTPASCNGTPVVIASAEPTHILCGGSTGSIEVTFSGGTAPYDITWTGGSADDLSGSPYTITGLAAGSYTITVTDNYGSSDLKDAVIEYLPVTNISDVPNTYYPTIQAAIDATTTDNGEIITVCAGTYAEDIVINKEIDLRGPKYGIAGNDGSRGIGEAIIHPATTSPYGEIIKVQASDVKINGFTIDGDNPVLISSHFGTNGADLNAAEAVTVYVDNVNNLKVSNNVIKNLTYFGVTIYGASFSAPATSGHEINYNLFQDMGTYDAASNMDYWGGGVLLYNNQYAKISNNIMNNVRLGVQTGNNSQTNTGAVDYQLIDHNTIQARRTGIFHNLHYSSASEITLSNNTINALANANETKWDGIALSSLSIPSTSTNNIINGNGISVTNLTKGYEVWNVKNTYPALISGGSVTGVDFGVFANNFEGYASNGTDGAHAVVSGVTITPKTGGVGVKVYDSPSYTGTNPALVSVEVKGNCSISGAATGILAEGDDASVTVTNNLTTITGNQIGILVKDGADLASVTGNTITNNANGGIIIESTAGTIGVINNNTISVNGLTADPIHGLGLKNELATVVDATNNWWGDASGPYHATYNTCGAGNAVVGPVKISPWLNGAGGSPVTLPIANITNSPNTYYCTIQDAINDATAGDEIKIMVASYTEPNQIDITKNISLIGAGISATTLMPGVNTTNGGNVKSEAFIYVDPLAIVTIKDLTIDCNGKQVNHAVQSLGALTVEDCDIRNVKYGQYYGRGIVFYSGTSGNLVKNVSMSNIERIGVHVRGNVTTPNPVVAIKNMTYTGKGAGTWLDYAVEFGGGGKGTVDNLNAQLCTGVADDAASSTSAGILVTDYWGTGTQATITNSTLTNNSTGIAVGYAPADASVVVANNNKIYGNDEFGIFSTGVSVDGRLNWWGSASGPAFAGNPCGAGDDVSVNVLYNCWSGDDAHAFNVCQLQAFNVTGTSSVCVGNTSALITLSGSQTDVVYDLYANTVLVAGAQKSGTGSALTWTVTPTANTVYTVKAKNSLSLCELPMTGSATIYYGPKTTAASFAACPNTDIVVPITVQSFSEVRSISLKLKYDTRVMTFSNDWVNSPLITFGSGDIFEIPSGEANFNVIIIGKSASGGSNFPTIPENEALLSLKFHYIDGASSLQWMDVYDTDCEYSFKNEEVAALEEAFCDGDVVSPATADPNYYVNGTITEDAIPPTALCQNITIQLDATGNKVITPSQIDNGSTDNCGIADLALSKTAFTCADIATNPNTVSLTVTDNSGNISSCIATVTVQDVTPPTAACQNITVQLNASGVATIAEDAVNNGSSDVCTAVTFDTDVTTFNCSDLGSNPVVLTVKDAYNNSSTCNAEVIVEDNILPVITCPGNITQSNDAGTCGAIVAITQATATDNCSATVSGARGDALALNVAYPVGVTTITWTATDPSGNSVSCSQTVTITDNQAPAITCPANVTVQVNASSNPSATGFATATDNCTASPVITFSDVWAAGSCVGTGTITRTWTAKDAALNPTTCVQTITIIDTQTPAITCPSDITAVNDAGKCEAVVTFDSPVSNDPGYNEGWESSNYISGDWIGWSAYNSNIIRVASGADGVTSASGGYHGLTQNPVSGQTGVFSRIGGYTSSFGNGYRIRQSVYMDLNDPAVLANTYGWDLSAASSRQNGAHLRDFIFHTASNASAQILVAGSNNSNGTRRNDLATLNHYTITTSGWYTFEFVFRNNAGALAVDLNLLNSTNSLLWTETRSAATDLIPSVVGGNRYLWFIFLAVDKLAIDNTSIERLTSVNASQASGTSFPVGTTPVTITSADACGNPSTCTFNVTVNDTEKPVITLLGNATEYVCQNSTYVDAGATAKDNCTGTLSIVTVNSVNTATPGEYTVTYNVSDAALNAAVQVTRTVIVRALPVVNAVALQTSTDKSSWSAISGDLALGYEMCIDPVIDYHYYDINTLSSSVPLKTTGFEQNAFYLDETSVPAGFYAYWDGKGVNAFATSGTWQALMWQIINGNAPMFYISYTGTDYKLIDGLQYQAGAGEQTLQINGAYPAGSYKFNGTVTDVNECVSLPFDVKLKLNSAPVITCPGNITVNNTVGQCGAIVNFTATASGTPAPTITYSPASGSFFPVGTTTVTATAENDCKTVTCTFTVTVVDAEKPVISLLGDALVHVCQNSPYTDAGATATDNCNGDLTASIVTVNPVDTDVPATYTVTYNVTDVATNAAIQVTRTVIVNPLPEVTAVTLQTSINESSWSAISGNLDDGYEMCIDPVFDYHYYDINTLTSSIDLKATDFVQNAFKLDVNSVPSGFTAYWDARGVNASAVSGTWQAVMYQIITGAQPMFYIQKDGTDYKLIDGLQYQFANVIKTLRINGEYPAGDYKFSGTVTDVNGCVSLPFDVKLKLNSAPVITCPGNITVNNTVGECGANVNFTATATGTPTPTITYSPASGSFFPVGTTTVTATASNGCKTVTCTFDVTVVDDQDPLITCPVTTAQNVFMNQVNGCTYVHSGTGWNATATDNCTPVNNITLTAMLTGATTSGPHTTLDGVVFNSGNTLVTWQAEDGAENIGECSFNVVVTGVTLSGTIKYHNNANTPMQNVEIKLVSGTTEVTTLPTATNGSYSFENVCPGTYNVVITVNKEVAGFLNVTDAAQVNSWFVNQNSSGIHTPSIEKVRFLAGDVSGNAVGSQSFGDFYLDSDDAGTIQRYFVTGGTQFQLAPQWEFWHASVIINTQQDDPLINNVLQVTIPGGVGTATQNFLAMVSGDFNRSFMPPANNKSGSLTGSSTLTLNQGENIEVLPSTTVDLPLKAETAMQVGAISLILDYPVEKLEVENVFLRNNQEQPVMFAIVDDELRIGWNSMEPISLAAGETMLTVRLKTTSSVVDDEVCQFKLSADPLNELADGSFEVIQNASLKVDGLKLAKNVMTGIEIPDLSSQMLLTAYPNPFREYAKIKYTLPEDGSVKIEVTGILGNRVRELTNQQQTTGEYLMNLDGDNIVPGVYQITLRFKNQFGKELTQTIRMVKQ